MENIHLIGAEDVRRAASNIGHAADRMHQSATNIDGSIDRLERVLTNFAQDLASIMHRLEEVQRKSSEAL